MTTAATKQRRQTKSSSLELLGQRYCIDIGLVEETVRAGELTSLPNAATAVAGMMTLRDQTTTVLDPAQLFAVGVAASAEQSITFDREDGIGWLVDRVNRVCSQHSRDVESVPDSPYVNGLIRDDGELLVWVDAEAVNGSGC